MKFELIEPRKQYSNSELIDDLKRVASLLNKCTVTLKEYQKYGNYSYQTQKKRFGSWEKALDAANLEEPKRPWGGDLSEIKIPKEELINDMLKVAKKLSKKTVTIADYEKHGKFGPTTISKRFGGWNKAKESAGLKIGRLYNSSEEDYFENLLTVWQTLGRQPKYHEMEGSLSKLHISSYERKFGTWRIALESFVDYANKKDGVSQPESQYVNEKALTTNAEPMRTPIISDGKKKPEKRTNRKAKSSSKISGSETG